MKFDNGSVSFLEIFEAPIYINATFILVLVYFGFKYSPLEAFLATVGYFILLLAHEIGHAFFVRKYGHELVDIRIYPIHGLCRFDVSSEVKPEILIYCGGLLAQFLLFVFWFAVIESLDFAGLQWFTEILAPLTLMLLWINLATFVLNLFPIPGLDGFQIFFRLLSMYKNRKQGIKNSVKRFDSPEDIVKRAIDKAKHGDT